MYNIAIDGPAGAGKSTIARLLAERLNIIYLDTGAMYRAIALKALEQKIDIHDNTQINSMLSSTRIEIKYENKAQLIFLDGVNVSSKIREPHMSKLASDISAVKEVRLKLVDMQREIAMSGNSVLDGRDIGSFVLPKAKYKFYLTASVEERARRRYEELKAKGMNVQLEDIKKDIEIRDYNDSNRDFAPLIKAKDAIIIDSSALNIDQVIGEFTKYIRE